MRSRSFLILPAVSIGGIVLAVLVVVVLSGGGEDTKTAGSVSPTATPTSVPSPSPMPPTSTAEPATATTEPEPPTVEPTTLPTAVPSAVPPTAAPVVADTVAPAATATTAPEPTSCPPGQLLVNGISNPDFCVDAPPIPVGRIVGFKESPRAGFCFASGVLPQVRIDCSNLVDNFGLLWHCDWARRLGPSSQQTWDCQGPFPNPDT